MKKDVVIKITGTQIAQGDRDVVELITTGQFCRRNKSYYIMYEESAAPRFRGARATLRFDPTQQRVIMSRPGSVES